MRNVNALYNKMRISDLEKLAPNTKWLNLLNQLWNIPKITILTNDEIVLDNPEFIRNIDILLKDADKR